MTAPRARRVRFRATDGRRVSARFTSPARRAPAAVLLHEVRGGPDQWKPLVADLHAAGFATLAYESRASWVEADRLPDALGAVRWLRGRRDVDRGRIGMVGASIGASTAALAVSTGARRTVRAVVALSPPDSSDVFALQGEGRWHPHDVLFVADDGECSSVEGMLDGAAHSRGLRSPRAGHGVVLLAEPAVRTALPRRLERRL